MSSAAVAYARCSHQREESRRLASYRSTSCFPPGALVSSHTQPVLRTALTARIPRNLLAVLEVPLSVDLRFSLPTTTDTSELSNMFDKVLVAVGLKKKMCEFCNASPVFEGYDYCSKSCGQYAKMGAPPPARGPPRNPAPQTRGRGRGGRNAGGHGPPSPRMCFTCGTRPVYKDRDYCSRSCSEGIPWSGPPSSAPPYPSDRRTNDRTRYRDSRADGSRDRRYSDYSPRAPDSRRPPRRGHQSSDEDDLPDTPPPGTNPRRPPPGRRTREEEDEANRDYPEDDYEPPSHREPQRRRNSPQRRWDNPQRQRDSPPPKPLPRLPDVRSPPAATSGSPWPPKTPQPRPRPRELGPYDEPQSD